ncbi:homoserine kinase [Salinibacter altiplanensis]|uniref:homoserine kinase n=1 Tax=Salinibacter altiplanensis TaxID=1803181 RepID=UPI000C9F034A|nr:homoserine kinase [Salinibacter altiplanensis]
MADQVTVFAPASMGNVAVGYDVLGGAIDGLGDRVTVRRLDTPTVRVGSITGRAPDLPTAPADNTASVALRSLRDAVGLDDGFEVSIEKGIPLGSGLGGSAASAVGAVVAGAALLPTSWSPADLLPHALAGEAVASGDLHPDNVAPCLFGGLVLTREMTPPDVVPIPVPSDVRCVLIRPNRVLHTQDARACLPDTVPLSKSVRQTAHLGAFVAGCYRDDLALIGRALRDLIVEPHRAALIPGFADVQDAALSHDALGCSLSGAGPTLFAWCTGPDHAERVRDAMIGAFTQHDVSAEAWISPIPSEGARITNLSPSDSQSP